MENTKTESKNTSQFISVALTIVVGVFGLFFFNKYRLANNELAELKRDPAEIVREETRQLVEKVAELTELPEGEEPTVATVTDVEKIKEQAFFSNALNDDKVLIYTEAKRAILYRPSSHKIIEVAPISIGQQAGIAGEDLLEGSLTVAIYNSTETPGLAGTAGDTIKEGASELNIDVSFLADAKQTYDNTIVVDVSGVNSSAAAVIAQTVGGTVGELPEAEDAPSSDILVIIGNDYLTK